MRVLIMAAIFALAGCTQTTQEISPPLNAMGMSNVSADGWSMFGCGDDNDTVYQTRFTAKGANGTPDLKGSLFLVCGCGAYAQCRKGDIIPLGRPALPELRKLRTKADEMFRMLRSKKRVDDAYDYVGRYTGLSAKHLASPDLWTEKDCNAIMSVAAKKLSEIGK